MRTTHYLRKAGSQSYQKPGNSYKEDTMEEIRSYEEQSLSEPERN